MGVKIASSSLHHEQYVFRAIHLTYLNSDSGCGEIGVSSRFSLTITTIISYSYSSAFICSTIFFPYKRDHSKDMYLTSTDDCSVDFGSCLAVITKKTFLDVFLAALSRLC